MRYLLLLASLLLLACGNPGGDPCEPPPDDWPSPEFTAEEFATSWDSPPLREGLYNLGGRRLVIPEGAWVDSGRGPSVSCLEGERCPSDGGILSLHGANLPEMGEERARIVFWLFDEGPTSWNLWIEGIWSQPPTTLPASTVIVPGTRKPTSRP